MAQITRSAKFASDWTSNELKAYNIQISTVNTQEFFGILNLPPPTVDPCILDLLNVNPPAGVTVNLPRDIRLFFCYLHNVFTRDPDTDDDSVNLFAFHLLGNILRYDEPDRALLLHPPLQLLMSGQRVDATPGIALCNKEEFLLLVQEDRQRYYTDDTEPRLIAQAMAAFHADGHRRTALRLPPQPSKTYLGIIMIGVAPVFYRITITEPLMDSVLTAQYPAQPAIVQRYYPPVPDSAMFRQEGTVCGLLLIDRFVSNASRR